MKAKKFKIKIHASSEDIRADIEHTLKLAEKGIVKDPDHDLILTFPDMSWLSRIFSPERMRLMQMIQKEHPEYIYQLAKLLNRQLANVQRDVYELAGFGIIVLKKIEKTDSKRESMKPCFEWSGFDVAV